MDSASAEELFTSLNPIARAIFHQDDDAILSYLVGKDGKVMEPEHYIPVIPLLLINGSEGIGSGWSTSIPPFDLKEIIQLLRNLLLDENLTKLSLFGSSMHPWYRGFRGTIEKSQSSGYIGVGRFYILDDRLLRVVEIPIRYSTQSYQSVLENLIDLGEIEDFYTDYLCDRAEFVVRFPKNVNLLCCEHSDIVSKLKLSFKISTTNLCAFGRSMRIRKYDSVGDILQEFFEVRLKFYEKRKKHKLDQLEKLSTRLKNEARFLKLVLDGELSFHARSKEELIENLMQKGLERINEEGDNSWGGFDYLLSKSLQWTLFAAENLSKTLTQIDDTWASMEGLRSISARELWLKDLNSLWALVVDN
eukprot:TRINITY_DN12050_c0_g2_i1.p1 TRINITY_DN12050_c0_g2~~TRINITY_DN12050_c0_g2_i1.p1  ORF type:complete len:369 (-),score=71.95 TRINITY_DN12050_c0_g2_i1:32-1114(-)